MTTDGSKFARIIKTGSGFVVQRAILVEGDKGPAEGEESDPESDLGGGGAPPVGGTADEPSSSASAEAPAPSSGKPQRGKSKKKEPEAAEAAPTKRQRRPTAKRA